MAGDGRRVKDFEPFLFESLAPEGDVVHRVGQVRLRSSTVHAVFDTDVDRGISGRQPEAATTGERVRFLKLPEVQDIDVEAASFVFGVYGDGDLGVVEV